MVISADRLSAQRQAVREFDIYDGLRLPPKSLLKSVAFPAWCLGHEPGLQILCVTYA